MTADPTPELVEATLALWKAIHGLDYIATKSYLSSQAHTEFCKMQIAFDTFAQARVEAEVKVAVEKERERIITDLRMRAADFGRSGYGDALDTFADDLEKQL